MLFYFYIGIVATCLIVYTVNKRSYPYYYRIFPYLFITVIVTEIAKYHSPESIQNLLNHIYQPVEITLLSILYWHAIPKEQFRKIIFIIIVFYWCASIVSSVIMEGLYSQNTFSFELGCIIVIFYSLKYIFELYTQPPEKESLLLNAFFWINTAHLFFYCGTFFQMGLDFYIRKYDAPLADKLFSINHVLNYAMYILYLTGFICRKIFRQ